MCIRDSASTTGFSRSISARHSLGSGSFINNEMPSPTTASMRKQRQGTASTAKKGVDETKKSVAGGDAAEKRKRAATSTPQKKPGNNSKRSRDDTASLASLSPATPSPIKREPASTRQSPKTPVAPGQRYTPAAAAATAAVPSPSPSSADPLFFRDVHVEDALEALSASDAQLSAVIKIAGVLPRIASCQQARAARDEPNRAFRSLARAIVFQQLNGTAAATIFNRVKAAVGAAHDDLALTPAAVATSEDGVLRACGLSQRKLEYLQGLAAAFSSPTDRGGLSDDALEAMSQTEVFEALVALRGVGPWSVHMFQMFYLNEPDVLPYSDFGVRKGVMKLYGLSAMPSKAKIEEVAQKWAPYRTLASFYMWHVADGAVDCPKPR